MDRRVRVLRRASPRDHDIREQRAAGRASAKFVIVGKKTTDVPVDLVRQDPPIVIVQSNAFQITYEGRLRKDTGQIIGTFTQGPYELPLNLHREP